MLNLQKYKIFYFDIKFHDKLQIEEKKIRPLPYTNNTVLRQKGFFVIFIIFISCQVKAQTSRTSNSVDNYQSGLHKTTITVNTGTAAFLWHWNAKFERMIISTPDKVLNTIWVSATYGRNYYSMTEGIYHSASLLIESLSGMGTHHFEMGFGISYEYAQTRYEEMLENYKMNPNHYPKEPSKSEFNLFLPAGFLGYRFQKQNGDLILRTGFGYPELLYVGAGIAF